MLTVTLGRNPQLFFNAMAERGLLSDPCFNENVADTYRLIAECAESPETVPSLADLIERAMEPRFEEFLFQEKKVHVYGFYIDNGQSSGTTLTLSWPAELPIEGLEAYEYIAAHFAVHLIMENGGDGGIIEEFNLESATCLAPEKTKFLAQGRVLDWDSPLDELLVVEAFDEQTATKLFLQYLAELDESSNPDRESLDLENNAVFRLTPMEKVNTMDAMQGMGLLFSGLYDD